MLIACQAEALLFDGRRVVVDASFIREKYRRGFLELASGLAVPAVFIDCQAAPEVIRQRLLDRRSDVSDADWSTHQHAVDRWEGIGSATRPFLQAVLNEGNIDRGFRVAHGDAAAASCLSVPARMIRTAAAESSRLNRADSRPFCRNRTRSRSGGRSNRRRHFADNRQNRRQYRRKTASKGSFSRQYLLGISVA